MSEVVYSNNTMNTNGTLTVNWDNTIWTGSSSNGGFFVPNTYPTPASKSDIERLEKEIQDLRKVLTELMSILGGKI
jgi:hypothetical protein